jgi:hypothetical protein
VAGGADEVARLTHVVDVAENDAGSALGETRGYGLADAAGGSGHQRNPSGVGFRGPVWRHVAGPCVSEPIGAYEATAGLSTSSHHWRKLVGVEFCGVRWTALSRPSFFAQAMSAYP